jgi:ribosomal protein S18 acetylase RimI-like enzyme
VVGEILSVHVHAAAWSLGVGGALMAAALDELRRQGCTDASLWVVRDNARARRFYERQGFQHDGQDRLDSTREFPLAEVRYTRAL